LDAWCRVKLQQLRYVIEIVRNGNHLSAAAESLSASQPGVSRQIQQLEAELGFDIFVRTRNRIIGLTEPGRQVYEYAQQIASEVAALRALKEEITAGNRGTLVVGTTHTQARYVLPAVIRNFVRLYPEVSLSLKQGHPEYACELVEAGEADIAITTETIREFPRLVRLKCAQLNRCVVARAGHPILSVEPLTLEAIAAHPVITYDAHYSGRWKVMHAFKAAGLTPKIILSAIDADVCKTYVEIGLGIAILSAVTFDPARDVGLGIRDAHHLFESSPINISLRSNTYLRPFLLDFIRAVAPQLTPDVVRKALEAHRISQTVGEGRKSNLLPE
jgi:LysR family transcriptional regulator, cys regulon transcriptional activator